MLQRQRHGALKVVRVAALLIIGLAVAQTASAGNVLFWGDMQQVDAAYPILDVITIGEGQTAMTTPGAVQGFTVPSKAFSAMGSGSFVSVFRRIRSSAMSRRTPMKPDCLGRVLSYRTRR